MGRLCPDGTGVRKKAWALWDEVGPPSLGWGFSRAEAGLGWEQGLGSRCEQERGLERVLGPASPLGSQSPSCPLLSGSTAVFPQLPGQAGTQRTCGLVPAGRMGRFSSASSQFPDVPRPGARGDADASRHHLCPLSGLFASHKAQRGYRWWGSLSGWVSA